MAKKNKIFGISDMRRRQKSKSSQRKTNKRGRKSTPKKNKIRHDWVRERINPDSRDIKMLKKAIQSLGKSVRRNVSQLKTFSEQKGLIPPALDNLIRSGGDKFTTSGSYESLYGEYLRELEFMQNPTHTRTGAEEWYNQIVNETREAFGDSPRPDLEERTKRYWRAFNHISQAYAYMFALPHFATDLIDATETHCIDVMDEEDDMYLYIESVAQDMYNRRMEMFKNFTEWGWD